MRREQRKLLQSRALRKRGLSTASYRIETYVSLRFVWFRLAVVAGTIFLPSTLCSSRSFVRLSFVSTPDLVDSFFFFLLFHPRSSCFHSFLSHSLAPQCFSPSPALSPPVSTLFITCTHTSFPTGFLPLSTFLTVLPQKSAVFFHP